MTTTKNRLIFTHMTGEHEYLIGRVWKTSDVHAAAAEGWLEEAELSSGSGARYIVRRRRLWERGTEPQPEPPQYVVFQPTPPRKGRRATDEGSISP